MATTRETGILTVASVRRPKGEGATQYLFNQRQRIFTLRPGAKGADEAAGRLAEAYERKAPVKVALNSRRSLIESARAPSSRELEGFLRARALLEKPGRTLRIDVDTLDPTKFNVVDYYLKVPIFKLCVKTVPSYTKAKEIFDYCASQSCHLPGPYGVTPCIPFQYVIDGCYARAHKMRWIITTKYKYCCEKVFSFANQNNDVLAVKADKWGGCCVTWWYHVAPLVRVRVKLGKFSLTLAMVIDPGMFDKPVLLTSWLSAQKNKTCDPNANVSMYSIQPGSAYSPDNYSGTAFTTDPNYTATDATLTNYQNLTTCP